MKEYVILAAVACACALLIALLRNPRALKKLVLGSFGGLAALGAVNLSGLATGVSLAPSIWTIGAAVFLGLPGVVSMLFIKLVMQV